MVLQAQTLELATRMKAARKGKVRELLKSEKTRINEFRSTLRGPDMMGRDSSGKDFPTKPPEFLNMCVTEKGNVRITYKKDVSKNVGEGRRRKVESWTDLFAGVRALMHVRETCDEGFEKRNGILERIEIVNSEVALEGPVMGRERVSSVIDELEKILVAISREQALESMLGKEKLRELFHYLEMMKSGSAIQNHISAVCSKLVSFRKNYGEVRGSHAVSVMAYNMLRECSLRMRRDIYLEALCGAWANQIDKYGHRMGHYWGRNLKTYNGIIGAIGMLEENDPSFGREMKKVMDFLWGSGPEGWVRERLENALLAGTKENMLGGLSSAAAFISKDRPWAVDWEIRETGDTYMDEATWNIWDGYVRLLKNDIWRSKRAFLDAAVILNAMNRNGEN